MASIALGVAGPRLLQMLAYQIDFLSVMAVGLYSESAKDGYVQDSSSARLSVSKALGI